MRYSERFILREPLKRNGHVGTQLEAHSVSCGICRKCEKSVVSCILKDSGNDNESVRTDQQMAALQSEIENLRELLKNLLLNILHVCANYEAFFMWFFFDAKRLSSFVVERHKGSGCYAI